MTKKLICPVMPPVIGFSRICLREACEWYENGCPAHPKKEPEGFIEMSIAEMERLYPFHMVKEKKK